MREFWYLVLLLDTKYTRGDEKSCANIVCHHDNVQVCGVRGDGSGEIAFRLFRDKCALQKYECQEDKMKDFNLVNIDYCKQAFSVNTFRRNSINNNDIVDENNEDGLKANRDQEPTDTANSNEHIACIQCSGSYQTKSVCAIRPEGDHFVIRWFPDECHMRQYNCENHSHFSITDDYICVGRNYSKNSTAETEKLNPSKALSCLQNDCIPDFKEICAIRPDNERFRVRWFDDKCEMLKYNCENHVIFSVTDDFICTGNDSSVKAHNNPFETQTNGRNIRELQGISDEIAEGAMGNDLTIKGAEGYEFKNKWNHMKSRIPNKLVVSTFDVTTENINETVKKFFASSHSTGIQLQKLGDEETRRMIVKNTGPINVYVPKTFRPANYTPLADRNINDDEKLKYSPLVQFCYHKCPEKCPDIYKPVCLGRGGDPRKQVSYISLRNHCYMDMAKCMTSSYKGINKTGHLEEVGFIFCGGFRMTNMVYMFPLIRILQGMGRLKKKGKVHFLMRDLGYFPERMQG